MFGDLGLSPGSSVTGAPHVLGADPRRRRGCDRSKERPDDGLQRRRLPSQQRLGRNRPRRADVLAGRAHRLSSLLLSSGSVTLNAEGNPNAVFIFQIGSTLITGSNTSVSLINGAQACNVFWQVGSSATLGTGTRFVGTIMASASITANTAATIHGRLLAQTAAVTLEDNTITTSNCASSASGGGGSEGSGGGGIETTTPAEAAKLAEANTLAEAVGSGATPATTTPLAPIGSRTIGKPGKHHTSLKHRHHSSRKHPLARPALPHKRGSLHRMSILSHRFGCCLVVGLAAVCLLGVTDGSAMAGGVQAQPAQARIQATQQLAVLSTAHGVRQAPEAGSPQTGLLPTRGPITGEPTTLPVIGALTGSDGVRWLRVMLPGRPNGSTGWIAQQGTRRLVTNWHIVVDLAGRRVSAYSNGPPPEKLSGRGGQALDADAHGRILRRGDAADGRPARPAARSRWLSAPAPTCCRNSKAARARSRSTGATISGERWAPPNRTAASAWPPRASTGSPPASARAHR